MVKKTMNLEELYLDVVSFCSILVLNNVRM